MCFSVYSHLYAFFFFVTVAEQARTGHPGALRAQTGTSQQSVHGA